MFTKVGENGWRQLQMLLERYRKVRVGYIRKNIKDVFSAVRMECFCVFCNTKEDSVQNG